MRKCARCGREHEESEGPLCGECRDELLSPGGGEGDVLRVRVAPVLSDALGSARPGEDLDEAILRALKRRYPERATELLSAVTRVIEVESKRANEGRQQTVRRLAEASPGPEVVLRTAQMEGSSRTSAGTTVIRIGGKEYHSLEEVPPHLRDVVARGMRGGEGQRVRVRRKVGCSWALVSCGIAAVLRMLGR